MTITLFVAASIVYALGFAVAYTWIDENLDTDAWGDREIVQLAIAGAVLWPVLPVSLPIGFVARRHAAKQRRARERKLEREAEETLKREGVL